MFWSIILFIALGHFSLLLLQALRNRESFYVHSLALNWSMLILFGVLWYIRSPAGWLLVSFWPLSLHMLINVFFEQPVADRRLGYLLGLCVFMAAICWLPFGRWGLSILLLSAGGLLTWRLIRLSQGRGISAGASERYTWLTLNLVFHALLVTGFLLSELLGYRIFQLLTSWSYLLLGVSGGWFFAKKTAFQPLKSRRKYQSSSLDQQEKFRILTALNYQVSDQRYLLDPNASMGGLARRIHTTPHQLSQVLNESKGMSFFDLLAHHRVQEARKLLRQQGNNAVRIEDVGEQVGYLSKSSFNTVFKKLTGKTPSQYRDANVRHHHVERQESIKMLKKSVSAGTFESVKIAGIMLNNFLKIYFRKLARNKTFGIINYTGLVIGIGSALLISVYLQDELSYDRYHERSGDIYRIALMGSNPQTRTPHPMAQAMVRDFPEVEAAVSLTPLYGPGLSKQSMYLSNPEKSVMFQEPDGYAADSTLFKVLDFRLLVGNEEDVLRQVGGILITESLAKKYFGDENPLGKTLELSTRRYPVMVSGVMEDVPENSHFHPRFIVSYVTLKYMDPDDPWMKWGDYGHFNYLKLKAGTDAVAVGNKIPEWLHGLGQISDTGYQDFLSGNWRFALQPLTDIHLKSHIRWELEANGNITYVYILLAAIVFILVIAAINFINLSTARAFERSREIGVRRTLGAGKWAISRQLLAENLLTCFLSLVVSYLLVVLFLPDFNQLTGKAFAVSDLLSTNMMALAGLFTAAIGVVSGIFPSVSVFAIKTGEILKGKLKSGTSGTLMRKLLIAVQFSVATILIFGSVILIGQVNYLENQPLGYDDQVLAVKLKSDEVKTRVEALEHEISGLDGVQSVGTISNLPGTQFDQHTVYTLEDPDLKVDVSELFTDFQGNAPLDLELVAGRWFDRSSQLDSGHAYIVNETTVKRLRLDDPIGQKVFWTNSDYQESGRIIGVVKDFHFQSLHVPIQPLLIEVNFEKLDYLLVKLKGGDWINSIDRIEKIYSQFDNRFDFEAVFLDQKNDQMYQAERRALTIFNLFAGIALGLSALGLLGLAYLIMVQRTKEIGIRKILGASISGLLMQENLTFLKWTLTGLLAGFPVGWFIMQQWLAGFAYRMSIGAGPFLITMAVIIFIAMTSVTLAILKTVLANPTESLRYE